MVRNITSDILYKAYEVNRGTVDVLDVDPDLLGVILEMVPEKRAAELRERLANPPADRKLSRRRRGSQTLK